MCPPAADHRLRCDLSGTRLPELHTPTRLRMHRVILLLVVDSEVDVLNCRIKLQLPSGVRQLNVMTKCKTKAYLRATDYH